MAHVVQKRRADAMTSAHLERIVALLAVIPALMWNASPMLATAGSDLHLERVVAALDRPDPSYRALRRLEAGNPGSSKHGWLEAWTELSPRNGLSIEVVAEGGSEYVRNNVLREILKREQDLIRNGEPPRLRLLPTNYAFEDGGIDRSGFWKVLLRPLRNVHGVVSGSALLSPHDGQLLQVAGRLAKNPSFWVRNVDVTWRFDRVGSAVMPIEIESTAMVRFYGSASFKMTYDYVSVDGRAIPSTKVRHEGS